MQRLRLEKEKNMSLVIMCDDCGFIERTPGFDEEVALWSGWSIRDFGHACARCTKKLDQLDDMESSNAYDPASIAQELTKPLKGK